ncbi:hypothetical protein, partial [Pseudomonas aeruginosa]|uniref:hypothetical protein n=1 Tax=Pseudomonas aeruginosa TaxID=287 RepID=UPI0034E0C7A0
MSFLNLPVRTLVAACCLSLLSLAAHADSFRGDAHAPQQAAVATPHPAATVARRSKSKAPRNGWNRC